MINLNVADYCHDCPYFEANVITNILSDPWEHPVRVTTRIECVNKDKCFNIHNHIERQINNNDKT